MTKPNLRVAVLYGSYREHRLGIRAAHFLMGELEGRCEATLVDAAAHGLPFLDKMYKEYQPEEAPAAMKEVHEIFDRSDAFVVVTGEYNHGMPPGLKNLLDHFQSEFLFKPAGIVSYSAGGFGGVRAAVHVRAVLGELGMATISSMLPVGKVGKAIDEEGHTSDSYLQRRVKPFLDELLWYADALHKARAAGKPF